ncbi:hypothetical protein [Microbacterium awajiense]
MEIILTSLVIPLAALAISLLILYFIIQNAIVTGMRRARREQYTEDYYPAKATWLTARQRDHLQRRVDGTLDTSE